VDGALSTGALSFLERTFVKAHHRVREEFSALRAQFSLGLVFLLAVELNHRVNGFLLPFDSRMLHNCVSQSLHFPIIKQPAGSHKL